MAQETTQTKGKRGGSALQKPVKPDAALAKIIGAAPLPRTEVTRKLWEYIREHKLQDQKNKRLINADENLREVFNGKDQVNMFEMTKLVSGHLVS